jgi:hypothetical protein
VSSERRNVPAVIETAATVKASSLRSTLAASAAIAGASDHPARQFLEFFAAKIRNRLGDIGVPCGSPVIPQSISVRLDEVIESPALSLTIHGMRATAAD